MLNYGFVNQLAHITQMLSFRLSFYVLEYYHGTAALGVYSNGISLAESVWMIGKSISMVQYARISNINDRKASAELTAMLSRVSVAASLLFLIPMLLLPENFYVLIFGEGFSETRMVLVTLAPGVLVYNYSILAGHYFSGTGRYSVNAAISSVGLAVSIALYFSLIPPYGAMGAGLATSLSYAATSAMFLIRFGHEYRHWHQVFMPTVNDYKLLFQELRNRFGNRS
jgi:O-antigen/teichoic acid export membrane protein